VIVVDTNTVAYLYLPTDQTSVVEKLLEFDSDWAAPMLWRSELRNILALYLRKNILQIDDAIDIQHQAETLLGHNEYEVNSNSVLTLAKASGCSAYDCEFISLAKYLSVRLVTFDKKLIKAFPTIAIPATDLLSSSP
jgi:predicted nucleic acid-binding protein